MKYRLRRSKSRPARPAKNRFNSETGVAHISKIFKWFSEDFEAAGGAVQSYLAGFVNDDAVAENLRQGEFKLLYID